MDARQLNESSDGVVKSKLKVGDDLFGSSMKHDKGSGNDSPSAKSVKKPKELKKETDVMVPESKFDELFQATLVEEDLDSETNPLEVTGDDAFNDETGDFPEDGMSSGDDDSVEDEVDVATSLRLIIDDLKNIAERLGAYDSESDLDDDLDGGDLGDDLDGLGAPDEDVPPSPGLRESARAGLKPFKNSAKAMQSRNNKVKSAFKVSSHGTGKAGGPGKGAADGKMKPFADKSALMQSKSNGKVASKMSGVGKSLFD